MLQALALPPVLCHTIGMETRGTMKYTPRAHQQAMLDAMAGAAKGIVQCPTGGGKTFTIITNAKQYLQG